MQHVRPARGRPVFLDRSGRRRRLVLLVGALVGVVLLASLVLLAAGLSGASPTRLPGFPGAVQHVDGATPGPSSAETTQRVPTTLPSPGTSPSAQPTSPRRIPTHTPSHHPKPTKT